MQAPIFIQADATRVPLADASVDAVIGSPPYGSQRTYGIGADRGPVQWANWMVEVTRESLRVTRGAVLWVIDDAVRNHELIPGIHMLIVAAYQAGLTVERPLIWRSNKAPSRHGVWWSHAYEHVLVFKREPKPLPHFDWMATATPTKYPTAGSFRQRTKGGKRPERLREYVAPEFAAPRDVIYAKVGGGHMGHPLATENEAPYPEALVEQLIPVLAPRGGTVFDPFSGSGTTACVAARLGRIGIGSDLRMSQCELGARRWATPYAKKTRPKKPSKGQQELFAA